MTYREYNKIIFGRKKYNVKFLADYLSLLFSYENIDFDSTTGAFSVDIKLVGSMSNLEINRLSFVISNHGYYDSFDENKFLIIPRLCPR